MLTIIKSGFGGGAAEHIKSLIYADVLRGRRCYLIVPEQQTVMAESEMAEALPKNSPLFFEATNFTRFANTTFRTLGGIAGEYCDKGKKALLMWRTLDELSPTLDMTAHSEINAGLVESALNAVAEMENLSITPKELFLCRDRITDDKRLYSKLTDLSEIFALYKKLLSEKYSDTSEISSVMLEKLSEHPEYLTDTNIYFQGFTSFTEAQYRLIGRMAGRTSVTLHLPMPKLGEGEFEYKEIASAEARLKRAASREGADIRVRSEDGRFNTSSELLSEIPRVIWKINPIIDKNYLQNSEELRIFEAATPFEECDFIASDIRRKVIAGAKYSDFAIIARDAEKYRGLLDGALHLSDIPHFSSVREDISSFEAVKLIYTAFSIIRGGFRREDVITYAKCGFSGISRDECDELELYTGTWQITGSRFTDGRAWTMNPEGYTAKKSAGTDEKLARINDIKVRLVAPLLKLREEMTRDITVREAALSLMNFLIGIRLEHSLKKKAELLKLSGDISAAEQTEGLWRLIINSFDSMVELLGELPCNIDSFLSQLKALFSYANLGKIPAFVDQVTIGSADMLRLSGKKHVYLMGVNAGEFPAAVKEGSYFSDKDRAALAEAGLDISPELEIKNARELFCFSRAFASGSESVTLIYTASDTKFKSVERAEVIDKLIAMTGGFIKVKRISELGARERFYSAAATVNSLDTVRDCDYEAVKAALSEAGCENLVAISEADIKNTSVTLSHALSERLYKNKMALTQSRLDAYASCPLNYLLRYTVKLCSYGRAEFDASSIGSFIHGCLENFFRTVTERGLEANELTQKERETLTRESAKKYLSEMGEDIENSRAKIKIKRLMRAAVPIVDALCDELAKSKFRPRFFELAIKPDSDDSPAPPRFKTEDGTSVYIYGVIDRVDTYREGDRLYVRVMDYKTGQKEFTPEDMEKGRNLQMFLYLKSLMDSDKAKFREKLGADSDTKIVPAGVIYVKTSLADGQIERNSDEDALEAVKKKQVREGMMLDSDENISATGEDYIPSKSKRDAEKYLYTEENFADIMKTVESSVLKIAEGIKSGRADAEPNIDGKYSPCDLCEYKPVCRNVKSKK